jgi:hypothetical protein
VLEWCPLLAEIQAQPIVGLAEANFLLVRITLQLDIF